MEEEKSREKRKKESKRECVTGTVRESVCTCVCERERERERERKCVGRSNTDDRKRVNWHSWIALFIFFLIKSHR